MDDAEKEFLELLISQCKSTRGPQNNRPEMAAVSAKWELRFVKRRDQLAKKAKKP